MEFLFDSANLEAIEKYSAYFPITGVTSNPSILKAEGKIDLFSHMRKIRQIIGPEKTLHMQVIAEDCEGILKEARAILMIWSISRSPQRKRDLKRCVPLRPKEFM